MYHYDGNLQAPYIGRGPDDDWDGYSTGEDYEDDRDVDAEYESWRDEQDEEKYQEVK